MQKYEQYFYLQNIILFFGTIGHNYSRIDTTIVMMTYILLSFHFSYEHYKSKRALFRLINTILLLYRRAIKQNHEFLADEAVIKAENNITRYQNILIGIINKTGSTDLASSLKRSLHPDLDKEAVQVLSSAPKFKPGTHKGKAVRVRFSVPITVERRKQETKK